MIQYFLFAWLAIVNFFGCIWCFLDKSASFRPNARRIPEMRFFVTALLGGTPGVLLGMYLFRHKTKKVSFQAILLIIGALQVGAIFYFLPILQNFFTDFLK